MTAAGGLAFTAAERVVDRVHGDAAVMRLLAEVTGAAGLADRHVLVLEIADLSDRRIAANVDFAHLARGKTQRGPVALTRDQLCADARGTDHLAALAFLQLHVVDHGAEGDLRQREGIAHQDVGVLAGGDHRAHCQAVRREDVALLAVDVVQQRDVRGAVRVVLDRRDLRGDPALVALEVDVAILLLVPAADEPRRDPAFAVAAARLRLALGEGLLGRRLGDVLERRMRLEPDARRSRLVFAGSHSFISLSAVWDYTPSMNSGAFSPCLSRT